MPRDTAGERVIPDLLLLLPMFSNPSVTACHLPYILRCKTQGRSFKISSIVKIEIPRKAMGHGREKAKMCFEDFSIEEMN